MSLPCQVLTDSSRYFSICHESSTETESYTIHYNTTNKEVNRINVRSLLSSKEIQTPEGGNNWIKEMYGGGGGGGGGGGEKNTSYDQDKIFHAIQMIWKPLT